VSAPSPADLLHAIETGLYVLPEVPGGRLTHLSVPSLLGRVTECAHPLANLVGAATFPDGTAANAGIAEIVRLAEGRGLPFGWVLGPSGTPADLRERLGAAGFAPAGVTMAGMVLRDLGAAPPAQDGVTVREVGPEAAPVLAPLMAEAYGLPADVAELLAASAFMPSPHWVRAYFAYVPGETAPVACGLGTYLADSDIFLLGGAATLPAHRGKGTYRALVARRLADARAEGRTAAVIQAVRETSAPVCARLGFEEACELEMYVYLPAGSAAPPHAA
jgi:GNAT superfamily N-acetyltransferase